VTIAKYRELRHNAEVLPDNGGYDLSSGEMNPAIYQRFSELLADEEVVSAWETFANPDGRTFKCFKEAGINLFATSLKSDSPAVTEVDATSYIPQFVYEGVLFHPPYFGTKPFTNDPREMSLITDEDEWRDALQSAVDIVKGRLVSKGIVCAVGRRYRHGGKEIRLDEWLVSAFEMIPTEVWISEPDVAIILRFKQ
jgi:hypothetical protein